ncbi:hypothetical protein [Thalassoglobus sp.]|uniref:hypothetical protein n=1 Tax=Thalassoglobus sp. TaxID=2795869 RepID=UPI003AA9A011
MMSRRVQNFALIAIACLSSPVWGAEMSLLPEKGSTPVVEMWYLNGYTPSYPEVIILADGRMQIMSPEGPQRSQLPVAQVEALVKQLWTVDGLCNVETHSMNKEIQQATVQSGLRSHIEGAGETVFRIQTATETRELRCRAVGVLAVRFPEIKSVLSMAAAQRRLENVRAVATVGGSAQADEIASLAAQAVQTEYGLNVPVSSEHLSMVRALPDGSRFCQFLVASDDHDQSKPVHMISITETPGHHPEVSMMGGPVTR